MKGDFDDDMADMNTPRCRCDGCICDRIRQLEAEIKAFDGTSAATYSVVVEPLRLRLDELKRLKAKMRPDWKAHIRER